MFILTFFSCFEDGSVESSTPNEQLTQDVQSLKEMVDQQASRLQSLQEDYDLLLSEYNTIVEENVEQAQQIEELKLSNDTATGIYQQNTDEIGALWTHVQAIPHIITTETVWNIDPRNGPLHGRYR